jgi:hypothetical protein
MHVICHTKLALSNRQENTTFDQTLPEIDSQVDIKTSAAKPGEDQGCHK